MTITPPHLWRCQRNWRGSQVILAEDEGQLRDVEAAGQTIINNLRASPQLLWEIRTILHLSPILRLQVGNIFIRTSFWNSSLRRERHHAGRKIKAWGGGRESWTGGLRGRQGVGLNSLEVKAVARRTAPTKSLFQSLTRKRPSISDFFPLRFRIMNSLRFSLMLSKAK